MAHHYGDFYRNFNTTIVAEEDGLEKDKNEPTSGSFDNKKIPIPKTNRPVCSNIIK